MVRLIESSETKPLRHLVLWPHINNVADCSLNIDFSKTTFHVGFVDQKILSIATFCEERNPEFSVAYQYRLRAMTTHPDYLGKGYGEKVMRFAFRKLKKIKCELLWCDARLNAIGFYDKLGFNKRGNVYEVPLIGPHYLMYFNV